MRLICFCLAVLIILSCRGGRQAKKNPSPVMTEFPFYPLEKPADLDILLREVGNRRIVLLGEASHGTAEYYTWRAEITRRLIREKGFYLVTVEGDWVDLLSMNEWIQGSGGDKPDPILARFDRWPQWLWANREAADFFQSLRAYNKESPALQKTGFYGLDLFDFYKSISEIRGLTSDSFVLHSLNQVQKCLDLHEKDAIRYSEKVVKSGENCAAEAEALWATIKAAASRKKRSAQLILLEQNAAVIRNGEQYFRTRTTDHASSWNGRVGHMQETIRRLMEMKGKNAKIIVWAHNTHVGDAHYTDMPTRQRTNIGELLRREYGEDEVFIVGFGSYRGELIAGGFWGEAPVKIKLRPAKEGTWEAMLHGDSAVNKILFSKDLRNSRRLTGWVPQRAVGVLHTITYIPSIIHRRYDAFIYFDSSHAIRLMEK